MGFYKMIEGDKHIGSGTFGDNPRPQEPTRHTGGSGDLSRKQGMTIGVPVGDQIGVPDKQFGFATAGDVHIGPVDPRGERTGILGPQMAVNPPGEGTGEDSPQSPFGPALPDTGAVFFHQEQREVGVDPVVAGRSIPRHTEHERTFTSPTEYLESRRGPAEEAAERVRSADNAKRERGDTRDLGITEEQRRDVVDLVDQALLDSNFIRRYTDVISGPRVMTISRDPEIEDNVFVTKVHTSHAHLNGYQGGAGDLEAVKGAMRSDDTCFQQTEFIADKLQREFVTLPAEGDTSALYAHAVLLVLPDEHARQALLDLQEQRGYPGDEEAGEEIYPVVSMHGVEAADTPPLGNVTVVDPTSLQMFDTNPDLAEVSFNQRATVARSIAPDNITESGVFVGTYAEYVRYLAHIGVTDPEFYPTDEPRLFPGASETVTALVAPSRETTAGVVEVPGRPIDLGLIAEEEVQRFDTRGAFAEAGVREDLIDVLSGLVNDRGVVEQVVLDFADNAKDATMTNVRDKVRGTTSYSFGVEKTMRAALTANELEGEALEEELDAVLDALAGAPYVSELDAVTYGITQLGEEGITNEFDAVRALQTGSVRAREIAGIPTLTSPTEQVAAADVPPQTTEVAREQTVISEPPGGVISEGARPLDTTETAKVMRRELRRAPVLAELLRSEPERPGETLSQRLLRLTQKADDLLEGRVRGVPGLDLPPELRRAAENRRENG